MSCTYCCDAEARCARDRCAVCCSCGRDLAAVVFPSIGDSTLFFNLPANAGLPGRGVLVEWGEGRVSAGLDAGPFVELPLGEPDGADEVTALSARVAELEGIRAEQAEKLRRHLDDLTNARGCYQQAMSAMSALYENAAALLPTGALPDAEHLGPEIGVEAAELARAIAVLVEDRDELRARLAEIDAERKLRLESADPDDETWHTREEYLRRIKAESELDALKARVVELEARPNSLTVARRMAAAEGKTLSGAGVVLAVLAGATTIEAAPPEDLLDRITPERACRHTRRSLRPNPHGVPVTTCIDCGDELP